LYKAWIFCELSGSQLLICIGRGYFVSLVAISYLSV